MKKYVLRSMVRAILDQPKVAKRYQSAMNAQILKRLTDSVPRRKNKKRTVEERFWRRVVQQDSCWLWRGRSLTISTAPGVISNPRRWAIERFAGGVVPPGTSPHPTCGHAACVNPEHQTLKRKGPSRLSEEEVAAIKSDSRPYPLIAKEHGICRSYVSQIRTGKRRISQLEDDSGFKLRTPLEPVPGI
jgi:hypothetical protein